MNLVRKLLGINAFVLFAMLRQAVPVFASGLEQDYRVARNGEALLVVGVVDGETHVVMPNPTMLQSYRTELTDQFIELLKK